MKKSLKEIIARHSKNGQWEKGWDLERCKRVDSGKEPEYSQDLEGKLLNLPNEFKPNALLNVPTTIQDVAKMAGIDNPQYLDEWEHRTKKKILRDIQIQYLNLLHQKESECTAVNMVIMIDAIRRYMQKNKITSCGWKKMIAGVIDKECLNEAANEANRLGAAGLYKQLREECGKDQTGQYMLNFEFDEDPANDILEITRDISPEKDIDDYLKLPPAMIHELSFRDGEKLANIANTVGMVDAMMSVQDHLNDLIEDFFSRPMTKQTKAEFKRKMTSFVAELNLADIVNNTIKSLQIGGGALNRKLDELEHAGRHRITIDPEERQIVRTWGW